MYRTLKERFCYSSARASPKETVMASASLANFKKILKTLIAVLYQYVMARSRYRKCGRQVSVTVYPLINSLYPVWLQCIPSFFQLSVFVWCIWISIAQLYRRTLALQAHDVKTTSYRRRCDYGVALTSVRRCFKVMCLQGFNLYTVYQQSVLVF